MVVYKVVRRHLRLSAIIFGGMAMSYTKGKKVVPRHPLLPLYAFRTRSSAEGFCSAVNRKYQSMVIRCQAVPCPHETKLQKIQYRRYKAANVYIALATGPLSQLLEVASHLILKRKLETYPDTVLCLSITALE